MKPLMISRCISLLPSTVPIFKTVSAVFLFLLWSIYFNFVISWRDLMVFFYLMIFIILILGCRTFSVAYHYYCGEMHSEISWWVQAHANPSHRALIYLLGVLHVCQHPFFHLLIWFPCLLRSLGVCFSSIDRSTMCFEIWYEVTVAYCVSI